MAWLACFYPDVYLDSTYDIDFEALYRKGFRGVIFDIDNTLVPHGAPADARSIALFERLGDIGFESVLLSNNKEPRVKMFNDEVHTRYIFKAGKPGKKGYLWHISVRDGDDEDRTGHHAFCGGSALYGCVGRKTGRDINVFGQTDSSEGGNPDCFKEKAGVDRAVFLQAFSGKETAWAKVRH